MPQRILFAVDGSWASQEALRIGARLVEAGTEYRAIYVVDRAVRLTDFAPLTVLEDALVKRVTPRSRKRASSSKHYQKRVAPG